MEEDEILLLSFGNGMKKILCFPNDYGPCPTLRADRINGLDLQNVDSTAAQKNPIQRQVSGEGQGENRHE
ncbi:hypothetical protein ACLOJK_011072 [Asimina triloba]